MKCLIIDAVHSSIKAELEKFMQVDEKLLPTGQQLKEVIGEYDLLIMRVDPAINREILEAGKKLRMIGVCAVGLNHVDLDAAKELGIAVFNAPGLNSNAVAELTISKMLDLSRDTMTANNDVKNNHTWNKYKFVGRELRGHILGVVGFGTIGKRVGELAQAFGMDVVAYDPFVSVEEGLKYNAEMKEIDELLKVADYVTIHVPLIASTKNMISKDQIEIMKDDCVLINMGRGGVVDETAVLDALKCGKIAGFGTDVLQAELTPGGTATGFTNPLFEMDRFIATPHIGAQTVDASRDIAEHILSKVEETLGIVIQ